ncbi:ATP-binding cassette domain-containing protein [Actinokineospora guangxiensis]|uniref:ATP-binding cassette domain-containing protein n=1 Tax=Actinokineospora guangxiensis TaxID=1490288 RepID=A0ABW0EVC1_9PSEU
MITARGLRRSFAVRGRTVEAVRGVDFDIGAGEIAAFLGPNGAGKTTTVRMLTTLLRPTGGQAVVAGKDLLADQRGVRRRIGCVAQGHGSAPDHQVREQIELQARIYGADKATAAAQAEKLMGELELSGLDKRVAKTLSGGQRRRLDLALGLVHTPRLVFLDEPTTGLDPQSRANLWAHIADLRAQRGATVFLTTHYLDEADALADRVFIMDNGTIVASGTPEELKSQVADDRITIGVPDHQRPRASAAVIALPGVSQVAATVAGLDFRVANGDALLVPLLRELDFAGVTATSVEVRRPTLDDVFLTLTGRSLREGAATVGAGR